MNHQSRITGTRITGTEILIHFYRLATHTSHDVALIYTPLPERAAMAVCTEKDIKFIESGEPMML